MDNNDIDNVKVERKIYTRDVLNLLRSSELSNLWPKNLDKSCINSHGQWDPVKSFDSSKPNDTKRNSFYESKSYKNNEKNKDDISLRPDMRKWNDGCQAPNNKRNSDEIHTNSYRKSYQSTTPSNGGGDFEKRSFSRNNSRSLNLRDNDRDIKYNTIKPEKFSKNNSNSEERRGDEKDGHTYQTKNGNNTRNNEPEWFSNGPDNCDDRIELRGITANDTSIIHFKKDTSKNNVKEESGNGTVKDIEKSVANFSKEKPIFIDTCITSPKREGSRFQDIFQKETKNNHLKESKDVEDILKAVLSENVSKIDAERLHNVSKPLPNGVLTLEEIERGMTSSPLEFKEGPSKSTTINTLTPFDPSQNLFLSNDVPSPIVDNSKVVNWLSNLSVNAKEPDPEVKLFYPESQNNFAPMNNVRPPQSMFMPPSYSNFASNLQHPPGLPLMLNSDQLLQQMHQEKQQQQQQQPFLRQHSLLQQQSMQQHVSMQQNQAIIQSSLANQKNIAFYKQNNANTSMRNSNMVNNPQEVYMSMNQQHQKQQQSLHNDAQVSPNILSSVFHHANINGTNGNSYLQMTNHINDRNNHNNNMTAIGPMNGPPGLASMSRAIVKTNPHQLMDLAQMNDNCRHSVANAQSYNHQQHRTVPWSLDALDGDRGQVRYGGGGGYRQQQQPPSSILDNLFNVNPSYLPPLPQQAKYADQIETENI